MRPDWIRISDHHFCDIDTDHYVPVERDKKRVRITCGRVSRVYKSAHYAGRALKINSKDIASAIYAYNKTGRLYKKKYKIEYVLDK
jgi:hypothetical protein